MKKSFILHDKNGLKFTIDCEIEDNNAGKPVFSASASYSGGGGQCLDSIVPANKHQKQFVDIWKKWHLNDTHAGCLHQQKEKKNFRKILDEEMATTKKPIKLLLKAQRTCKICKWVWGRGWQYRELPANFELTLNSLVNTIERLDIQSANPTLTDLMQENGIDEDMAEACQAYLDIMGTTDLDDFEESYQGQFDSDKNFAEDMAENLGEIDNDAHWPHNCIDWEHAARELMYDYSEENGYYFRNL